MSLILDALNRAERERKKTRDVPDLQTVHEPLPAAAVSSSGRKPVLVVLGVAAVVLLVVMVYMFARAPEVVSPVVQPMAEPGIQSVKNPARVAPAPVNDAAPAERGNSQRKLTTGESRTAAPVSGGGAAAQPDLDALYASARAEDKPSDPVNSLYAATPEVENPTVARRETVAVLPPVAVRNYDSLVDIPDIGDLPWGFRNEIPSINYIRHNFGEGGASSVVINSKAHYAGSNLAPDLVLEEIYVDGAIFQFKQIKFKLRALNSWVNM